MLRPATLPDVIKASAPETPELLAIACEATIEAAGGEDSIPSFKMIAYTGGAMRVGGFPHPVVVPMEGIAIKRQNLPVRMDHQPGKGVGHTTRVAVTDGQLLAEGLISRDTSWARDVVASGKRGFPWQASIGAYVLRAEFIPAGRKADANGRTFEGPLYVAHQIQLKEISFVDDGADGETSVQVAAQAAQTNTGEADMKFEQWLKAKGFDPETLTEDQTAALQASFDAEQAAADGGGDKDGTKDEKTVEATGQEAPETTIEATGDGQADYIAARRRAEADEVRRIEAIRKTCGGRHPDIEAKAIEEGWDEMRTENAVLKASSPNVTAIHTGGQQAGPRVLEAAALMTANVAERRLTEVHRFDERTLEAADRLRGVSIRRFCELACGNRLPDIQGDTTGWLEAAFSSTSLPGILSNVANKMLLEGYNYSEDVWRRICKIASVNDFKQHTRYRMGGDFKFLKVGADGELKHGALSEQSFTQQADTFGIMFALTRKMIVNDDMGAFADIPMEIGRGAGDAINDAVWTLLLSNPEQADGEDFFSAAHKNYASGADSALSVDGLTAADLLFANQTKPNGRPLGALAEILLVPSALRIEAKRLMTSVMLNETTTANKPKPVDNPHAGAYRVESSAYLGNSSFTGYSSKAWYLQADPNRVPALEVAFLNGVDRPTVERANADFNTLGIQFRGYIDFGVKEQDYRGIVKMAGE